MGFGFVGILPSKFFGNSLRRPPHRIVRVNVSDLAFFSPQNPSIFPSLRFYEQATVPGTIAHTAWSFPACYDVKWCPHLPSALAQALSITAYSAVGFYALFMTICVIGSWIKARRPESRGRKDDTRIADSLQKTYGRVFPSPADRDRKIRKLRMSVKRRRCRGAVL